MGSRPGVFNSSAFGASLAGFYVKDLRWKQEWGKPGFIVEILLDNMRDVTYIRVDFEVNGELLAWEEADRGTVAPWLPPPKEKRRPGPPGSQVYVYTDPPAT
jgi:hypothetical protein